ncbi:MAG: carboxymuconolactone decarboxylase family protein [Pirellulales bacterium]
MHSIQFHRPALARPCVPLVALFTALLFGQWAKADEAVAAIEPEPVPLTRDDMKRALDASKQSVPRLPLPPVTEEEQALIEEQKAQAAASGEKPRRLGLANNGRMRAYYLPEYGFARSADIDRARSGTYRQRGGSNLDPILRTMIFWIVSRGNNCTYCLGHQESGLAGRDVSDDELAALDGDWSEFDAARQAAFQFAHKLSFEPYAIVDSDIQALRGHYNDAEITDIVAAVAGFNATNRWTGPLRIKQDVSFQFTRPTSPKYAAAISRVAPLAQTKAATGMAAPAVRPRPPLETPDEVQSHLATARTRTPRLPLANESDARAALGDESTDAVPAQWVRLLAAQSNAGGERIQSYQAVLEKGTLDPRYKAIIAYIGARHDRAWYALGHAIARLKKLGFSSEEILALDTPEDISSPADRQVALFARKITVDPALADDGDFSRLKEHFEDKQVAEVVYQVTQAAYFDRLTEAAGLQLEID